MDVLIKLSWMTIKNNLNFKIKLHEYFTYNYIFLSIDFNKTCYKELILFLAV